MTTDAASSSNRVALGPQLPDASTAGTASAKPGGSKSMQDHVDELLSTPLFMTHLPSNDKEAEDDTMAALQSLVFDGTPEEVAENFKVQGNSMFKEGRRGYRDAIKYYTKGIAANANDNILNSVLYSNRAAVHLELGNNRSVLNDCASAIRLNPSNIKAYYRSVKALYALDRVDEGIDCCTRALAIEPDNTAFEIELKKLNARKTVVDEANAKRKLEEERRAHERARLSAALSDRGYKAVRTKHAAPNDDEDEDIVEIDFKSGTASSLAAEALLQHPMAPSQRIHIDPETLRLHFPVVFLYPEHNQSDFISSFSEDDTFYSHFETVFADKAIWDTDSKYHAQTLDLYFETPATPTKAAELVSVLRNVKPSKAPAQSAAHRYVYTTLGDVLRHEKYRIVDGVCTFIVVARDSEFAEDLKQQYRS